MSWKILSVPNQVSEIIEVSRQKPQLFFKHSTRCSISTMALSRFEKSGILTNEHLDCWYLDLLEFRQISSEIEKLTKVIHQSPQAILVHNEQMVYAESHGMIDAVEILKLV
jgi:bacillithiol system protein YtxJ